ncbi:MAG: hypothetical protein WC322_02790 [Candidatus Paceibacterota bacterium]
MKWPRQYFIAYMQAKGDKEAEREALKGCPVEFQALVRTHIRIEEARREWQQKQSATK